MQLRDISALNDLDHLLAIDDLSGVRNIAYSSNYAEYSRWLGIPRTVPDTLF